MQGAGQGLTALRRRSLLLLLQGSMQPGVQNEFAKCVLHSNLSAEDTVANNKYINMLHMV